MRGWSPATSSSSTQGESSSSSGRTSRRPPRRRFESAADMFSSNGAQSTHSRSWGERRRKGTNEERAVCDLDGARRPGRSHGLCGRRLRRRWGRWCGGRGGHHGGGGQGRGGGRGNQTHPGGG